MRWKKVLAVLAVTSMLIGNSAEAAPVVSETKENYQYSRGDEKQEAIVKYLYLAQSDIHTPEIQKVAISLNVDSSDVELVSCDENGYEIIWKCKKKDNGVYFFEKEFSDNDTGIQQFQSLSYFDEKGEHQVLFQDLGMNVKFGINKEIQETEKSNHISIEKPATVESETTVFVDQNENTIVSGDTNTDFMAVELQDAGLDRLSRTRSAKQEYILVLDPGHDSKHTGASGNGVREEIVTLKIAEYCKQELEEYNNVTVYMTRTSAQCPYPSSSSNIDDIKKRVAWAKGKGADAFISFHLNSASSSAANGAEVYYPGTWTGNQAAVEEGKKLADAILDELEAVGLYGRKTESWDYTVNEESAAAGFPGLIIEHAFLSNPGDANTYLKTESGMKKLGVADATGIAKALGLKKVKQGWVIENGKTYYYENQQPVKGQKLIDGNWYYFDEKTGIMKTGFVNITEQNKTVYYDETGAMVHGQKRINGKWYYFDEGTGAMRTGFVNIAEQNKAVYYDETGAMVHGQKRINGKWYYFDEGTGAMKTGFVSIAKQNKTVYYDETGAMIYGQKQINGKWYYFDQGTGGMKTGFVDIAEQNKTVYYDKTGVMLHGQKQIDGKWYYFDEETGGMKTGFVSIAEQNKTVYYDKTGVMFHGQKQIDGKWYYFDEGTGGMKTGFVNIAEQNKTVYYDKTGAMVYGKQFISGDWYYFLSGTGQMAIDTYIEGYYYDKEGKQQPLESIEGKPGKNAVQTMIRLYKLYSPIEYPKEELEKGGAPSLESFADIYYEEAVAEGIRPEVAWAQTMLETNWLKFGGQVDISQFNFAGLGATDNGAAGADFSGYGNQAVRMGVRAQIQHLKAYAFAEITETTLSYPCVDERFNFVNPKGCARFVQWLGIKENPFGKGWATGERYGHNIVKILYMM